VTDCPLSIVGDEGVIAPATSAGLTVTMSPDEQAVAAPAELLSVTL
jgi:hypothetical protein